MHGLPVHITEAGEGPLVVLVHGWPETSYSWRHQIPALAEAGYRVVAPDGRGYGRTGRPEAVEEYTSLHAVGDIVGLIEALGEENAVLVGHDWGGGLVMLAASLRPDRIRAVVGLSVGHAPRGSGGGFGGGEIPPVEGLRAVLGDGFYVAHFQTPGAEAELDRDPRTTMRRILHGLSGEAEPWPAAVPPGGGLLDGLAEPTGPSAWLTEADLDVYAAEFTRTGFAGGLNYYRNIDRNWSLLRAWNRTPVTRPALYIVGDRDVVYSDAHIADTRAYVPGLRDVVVLPGCGHWTQQERPAEVNAALVDFLGSL